MVLPRLRVAALFAVFIAGASVIAIPTDSAQAAGPPSTDIGLYGSTDPTYDGVYRQSLAILGLTSAGQAPDERAVAWLLAQQCADGAFTAYRADIAAPCDPKAEDENATALAVQALVALGKPTTTAVAALRRFQLGDGGFYDSAAFGPPASDANSTGLALAAFTAVGVDPATVTKNGANGDAFLRSVQLDCTAANGAGAFDFQPEKTLVANDFATVQALLGQLGKSLPVAAAPPAGPPNFVPACNGPTDRRTSADAAVAYLATRLTATKGAIPAVGGKGTDWTTTSFAVIDVVASGAGLAPIGPALDALRAGADSYAHGGGVAQAGALGTLLLVAHATATDPHNFGSIDLVAELAASERTAAATPPITPTTPTPSATTPPTLPMTGGHVTTLTLLAGLLILLGGLGVAAGRRQGR